MDDDQQTQNLVTETPDDSSTSEQTAEEATPQSGSEPEGSTKQQDEEAESGRAPRKGAEQRIKELNAKAKAYESEAVSLKQKLAELTGSFDSKVDPIQPLQPTNTPIIGDNEEITREELNRRLNEREQQILQKATASAQLISKQTRILDNINREAVQAIEAYKELDPDSESFNRELSDTVTEATEAFVRSNPTSSVKKFVDKLMKPYQRSVQKEVVRQAETIAKQASETALRPSHVKPADKSAKDMSIEELEKKIGIVW